MDEWSSIEIPSVVDFQNPQIVYPFVGGDEVLIIFVSRETPLLNVWALFSCPAASDPLSEPDETLHPAGLTTCHLDVLRLVPEKSSKNRNVASPSLAEGAEGFP